MTQNKKVVGITGASGAGKSHISQKLRDLGYEVIDADKTAHESINKSACKEELCEYFGKEILNGENIDRKKLGKIVFQNPEKLEKLNEITHKYILSDIADQIKKTKGKTVFVDGAVLIESGMKCDIMIGVLADKKIRIERIVSRDRITEESAQKRILAQQDDGFYRKNCDFVIINNGGDVDLSAILTRIEE